MLRPALIDTDVLLALMRGPDPIVRRRARVHLALHQRFAISTATVLELGAGAARRGQALELDRILDPCEILSVDAEVAQLAGALDGATKARGVALGTLDPLIAATAIAYDLVLVSFGRFEALQAAATELGHALEIVDWRRPPGL